jgi:hypothetical protein
MTMPQATRSSLDKRKARGKQAREQAPPSSHAGRDPVAGRPDPPVRLDMQQRRACANAAALQDRISGG